MVGCGAHANSAVSSRPTQVALGLDWLRIGPRHTSSSHPVFPFHADFPSDRGRCRIADLDMDLDPDPDLNLDRLRWPTTDQDPPEQSEPKETLDAPGRMRAGQVSNLGRNLPSRRPGARPDAGSREPHSRERPSRSHSNLPATFI